MHACISYLDHVLIQPALPSVGECSLGKKSSKLFYKVKIAKGKKNSVPELRSRFWSPGSLPGERVSLLDAEKIFSSWRNAQLYLVDALHSLSRLNRDSLICAPFYFPDLFLTRLKNFRKALIHLWAAAVLEKSLHIFGYFSYIHSPVRRYETEQQSRFLIL